MPAKAGVRRRKLQTHTDRVHFAFPTVMLMLIAVVIAPVLIVASMAGAANGLIGENQATPVQASLAVSNDGGIYNAPFHNGIPECLRTCSDRLQQCQEERFEDLRSQLQSLEPTSTDPLLHYLSDKGLHSCGSSFSSCTASCVIQPLPAVSCDASCAASLGACIRSSGTKHEDAVCRLHNLTCLDKCGGGGGNIELIPPALCHTECRLGLDACLAWSRYDAVAQDACRTTASRCNTDICDDALLSMLGLLKPKETRASCSARCAEARATCRTIAEGDAKGLSACETIGQECLVSCQEAIPHFGTVLSFPPSSMSAQGGTTP